MSDEVKKNEEASTIDAVGAKMIEAIRAMEPPLRPIAQWQNPMHFGAVYGDVDADQAAKNTKAVYDAIRASADSFSTSFRPNGLRGACVFISDHLVVDDVISNIYKNPDNGTWSYIPLVLLGHGQGISSIRRSTPGTCVRQAHRSDLDPSGRRINSAEFRSVGVDGVPGLPKRVFHIGEISLLAHGHALQLTCGDSSFWPIIQSVRCHSSDPQLAGFRADDVYYAVIDDLHANHCAGDGIAVAGCNNISMQAMATNCGGNGIHWAGNGSTLRIWGELNREHGMVLKGTGNDIDAWFERSWATNGRSAPLNPNVLVTGKDNRINGVGVVCQYANRTAMLTTRVNGSRRLDSEPRLSFEVLDAVYRLPADYHTSKDRHIRFQPFGEMLEGVRINRGDFIVLEVDWQVTKGWEYYAALVPSQESVTEDFGSNRVWNCYFEELHWGTPLVPPRLDWPDGHCFDPYEIKTRHEQIYEYGDEQSVVLSRNWPRFFLRKKGIPNPEIEIVFRKIKLMVY